MIGDGADVKGDAETVLSTELTLSAAPAIVQPGDGIPAYLLVPVELDGQTPHELTVREYAELVHIPESELRALWGDR